MNPVARQLYVSNYSSGELLCYALDDKGLPAGEPQALRRQGSGPRADRQDGPHAHFAMPDAAGAHVYLCDLGTDAIVRHRVQADGLAPEPDWTLRARPGSGPRHLVLAGALIVAVNELSNTLSVYGQAEDARTPPRELAHASTLPPGWTGASYRGARLHPNGRLLMVSNRGHDSIAAFRLRRDAPWLEPLGHFPAGGRTPRDIAFTPDGAFLLIASQDDHLIRALRIDPVTGMPERAGASFALRSPVSLCPCCPEPETLNVTASLPRPHRRHRRHRPDRPQGSGHPGAPGLVRTPGRHRPARGRHPVRARAARTPDAGRRRSRGSRWRMDPPFRGRRRRAAPGRPPFHARRQLGRGAGFLQHDAERADGRGYAWRAPAGVLIVEPCHGWLQGPAAGRAHGPRQLTAQTELAPGTRWFDGQRDVHSLAYGTSKVMGERLCRAYSAVTEGRLSTVAARIGWILPDGNDPRDITYSGVAHQRAPADGALDEPSRRALTWFRDMWLSNGDLERLLIAALTADSSNWEGGSVIVNGVSANRGSAWDVAGGRASIGYDPQDDVQERLRVAP